MVAAVLKGIWNAWPTERRWQRRKECLAAALAPFNPLASHLALTFGEKESFERIWGNFPIFERLIFVRGAVSQQNELAS